MNITKEKKVNDILEKLKKIIDKSLLNSNYDTALAGIIASANIKYFWNQEYTDEYLEEQIKKLSRNFLKISGENSNWILFYDGFGLDTRGLAIIYLKALVDLGYSILYITVYEGKKRQVEIDKVLSKSKNFRKVYLHSLDPSDKIREFLDATGRYKPRNAFLYTTPGDVSGIIAFECMSNITRYQINLTDHAFWLGKYAFDYCIEFREYGAIVSRDYRNIESKKIKLLPYYPYINYDEEYMGLPFDRKDNKVIFSGGSLYKTIDKYGTYYDIIRTLLAKRDNVVFLYAGGGDDRYLRNLQSEFQNRVYHIEERKDLYQLLCNIDVYLNTYPVIGGLMMQYAAIAGKPPITLYSGDDSDGILINQDNINVLFDTKEEVVNEVLRLLDDVKYKNERADDIKRSVISSSDFTANLKSLLSIQRTNFNIDYKHIDTKEFIAEYINRFSIDCIRNCVINMETMSLGKEFPKMYLKRLPKYIAKKWRRKCKL